MPSRAFLKWSTVGQSALNEIESAHRAVGGSAPGRRYATQQINQALAVMLSSQFQAFCRDLHTEAADHFVAHLDSDASASSQAIRDIIHGRLVENRRLDRGNPNPGNLGADFGRFGFIFVEEMKGSSSAPVVVNDLRLLHHLSLWRNAIAHQDFSSRDFTGEFLGRATLGLNEVKRWRAACRRLARRMDAVVGEQLSRLFGSPPW